MSKKVSLLSKGVKMFEVWKLSNQSVVCYTITIVINISFLLSIHHYRSVNITIDLFSLGGLFSHFRPCDDTLENSCFQIFK